MNSILFCLLPLHLVVCLVAVLNSEVVVYIYLYASLNA